ncbi:MFS transporter [Halopseudomonas maritima]|uniref:MFS transporter n=1 Tax=Halopseudomonas maritima TaxID=2918528 RepID=UPI001EEA68C6|nr:MFS transporter [Halopseudomonas maritima]UJJ32212.1 MFS transporter [Halopseudomonas maritima]
MSALPLTGKGRVTLNLAMLINMLSIGSTMMVMPLAADLAAPLDMPPQYAGYIAGLAGLAAALASWVAAPWLDRFARRPLLVGLAALRFAVLAACAVVQNSTQLMCLFALSGVFAGPMAATLMAAIVDMTPAVQRGRQLAYVAMGFSLAGIAVVPLALGLSQWLSWRWAFLVIGIAGLLLTLLVALLFPLLDEHRASRRGRLQFRADPLWLWAMLVVAVQAGAHSLLIPHFASYFRFNLGVAREMIPLLFMLGGLASMAAMQLSGRLIDRGHTLVAVIGSNLLLIFATLIGFVWGPMLLPLLFIFPLFMAASSARFSAAQTITAGIPEPEQRAGFMSWQNTLAGLASGAASVAGGYFLSSTDDGALQGYSCLALVSLLGVAVALFGTIMIVLGLRQPVGGEVPKG